MKKLSIYGDTLVETVLALSVLSLVLFVSWSVINRSNQVSTNSRKRIEMVGMLKEQAEILKSIYANNANNAGGYKVKATGGIGEDTAIRINPCQDAALNNSANIARGKDFYYKSDGSVAPGSYKDVYGDNSAKVWLQYKNGSDSSGPYTDFYVSGCWQANEGVDAQDNSRILVRLNG